MLDVIKWRVLYYSIAGALTLFSVWAFLFIPLNYGIDMTGGIQMEYGYTDGIEIEKLREKVEPLKEEISHNNNNVFTKVEIYQITWENKIGIVAWINSHDITEVELETIKSTFRNKTLEVLKWENPSFRETLYINVGESFWEYIRNTAILTLWIAILAIWAYVAFAFSGFAAWISSFSFWSITILTLFHDVIVAAGLYIFVSVFYREYQIDTFFITALLTILGYSINDTIVVFDRIRSNLTKKIKKGKVDIAEIINVSVNETLARSIYTSLTLFIVLVAIFFFWPEAISGFILVMIFGTLVWTYSSIFIASPILYDFNKHKEIKLIEKKEYNPDDKIVV